MAPSTKILPPQKIWAEKISCQFQEMSFMTLHPGKLMYEAKCPSSKHIFWLGIREILEKTFLQGKVKMATQESLEASRINFSLEFQNQVITMVVLMLLY